MDGPNFSKRTAAGHEVASCLVDKMFWETHNVPHVPVHVHVCEPASDMLNFTFSYVIG